MNSIKDFDYVFYINYYSDLKKNKITNYERALKHYKNNGIKEKRFFSFEHSKIWYENSWVLYKMKNVDLKKIIKNEKDAFEHYMNFGIKEDRKIYPISVAYLDKFNWDLFEYKFYAEINHLDFKNKNEAIVHFKNIGRKLNLMHDTKHSNLFYNHDWDRYITEYDDLDFIVVKDAFFHYLDYGKKEGRKLFRKDDLNAKIDIFNWKFYLEINNDLILNNICDKEKALKHFKNVGHKESRLYSHYHYLIYINHDWKRYSTMYKLKKQPIDAFKYYISSGIKMNHKIFHIISKQNFYTDFFKSINKLDDLDSFDKCKKYYLKLNKKIPYSYEQYLIYILFDWKKMYDVHLEYYETLQIYNSDDFFKEYIYNYQKYRVKLLLNDDIDRIYNFEKIDELFSNSTLTNNIINYNLIYNDQDFIKELINIQKKLNELLSFNFNFIKIPPGFEFKDYIYNNGNYTYAIIISSFNNQNNIYNNLLSVIYQNYKNWKIYYTNDASSDNTDELFHKIVEKFNIKEKIVYFKNDINMRQSFCKNRSYKYLKDFDIVTLLDGDDWLASNNVLSLLSEEYSKSNNTLIVYSGYHVYYENKIYKTVHGNEYPEEIKQNKSYRSHPSWLFTHLKTGYAWLFKKIPDEYFMFENNWLDRCTDLAEMYSAAELAGKNVKHLKEILYVYNKQNSLKYNTSYYNDYNSDKRKTIEEYVKTLRPLNIHLPKIFIINLKNRIDLKNKLKDQFNIIGIKNIEFFEALNGYTNDIIKEKYDEYLLKFNNKKISDITLGVTKKHINSLGALGVIYSTIELYKKINENNNLNHVIILEDDVYIHKNFINYYQILNSDLYDKDYIYLGFNSLSSKINKLLNENEIKLIELNDISLAEATLYGAYSYICSRKYREFIISLGINFFIDNNVNLDAAINIYLGKDEIKTVKNDLKFYILNNHLFIPEVRKNGINEVRTNNFYKERFINLDNYLI